MNYNLIYLLKDKNNYARHLGAAITSVLENTKKKWNIYIIYTELSENSKKKLLEIRDKYSTEIIFVKLEDKMVENFKLGAGTHLDKIVFGRLYIPNLIFQEKKAIYLDIDMIVEKPLEELYEIELENFLLEQFLKKRRHRKKIKKD